MSMLTPTIRCGWPSPRKERNSASQPIAARRNVDLGSDPSYWLPCFVVRDEDARLDPPHLTVAEYPIFDYELSIAISEGAASNDVQLWEIIRMHPCAPIFA